MHKNNSEEQSLMHERRKFIRFNVPLDMEFRISENAAEYSPGITVNFSREGFCFETRNSSLSLNEILELNINHPSKESVIPVLGEIVWLERTKDKHFAGIRLKEMDKAAKSEILDHAYDIWLQDIQH